MPNGTSPLCLACSASLPLKYEEYGFMTKCCQRPICQNCIAANSRLTRYSPCLMCLVGVDAVKAHNPGDHNVLNNLDGGLRDQDVFAIGDENDTGDTVSGETVALDYSPGAVILESSLENPSAAEAQLPPMYRIKPNDTMQGIALRFGVPGRELCILNNLPPSTLTTTPHLLHTRSEFLFPTYSHSRLAQQYPSGTRKADEARERERAAKRLQTLTKEADWNIARAYVALAGDDTSDKERLKLKEVVNRPSDPYSVAAQKYLDDDEWEREQGSVKIQGFPYIKNSEVGQSSSGRRWFSKGKH